MNIFIVIDKDAELFIIDNRFDLSLLTDILKLGLLISGALFMEGSVFACITLFIGVLGAITMPMGYMLSLTDIILPAMGAKGFWISLIAGLTISGIFLSVRLDLVSRRLIR